jgi:NAD-dependent DNA ligase
MNIQSIIKNPTGFLEKSKKKDIITFLKNADIAFFNTGEPLVSDDIYDIIKDYVRDKYPKDPYLKRVGADEDNKVKLPYYMGSQNKIRDDENEIKKFSTKYKGPYVVSDKLDGISCLVVYKQDDVKIYTRGNGVEGQDISHIINEVQGIPKKLGVQEIAVRGELIISRNNWEILKEFGANARNVVAGTINSKIANKVILNKIEFVAYNVLHPPMNLNESLVYLKNNGFKVVRYNVINMLNLEILSGYLQNWRQSAEYDIDGIVISDINYHPVVKGKNPDYSFAFKSIHTHEQVEVIVTEVEWNVSKDKYLKPIVKFNEIELDGVKIKQATGFNAAFIEKNKIGAGSRIIVIRSGSVIPHIISVLSPSASAQPSMPTVNYKWNDTHIDIILTDDSNKEHDIKEITYFLKTLEIENMAAGVVTKLYNAGFNTIKKILNIKKDDLLKIDGFKEKSATKILESLLKANNVDCVTLMVASNILGRGFSHKKIKMITDEYPVILRQDCKSRTKAILLKVEDLIKIQGIAETSAKLFLENLPKFYEYYDNLGIKCSSSSSVLQNSPEQIQYNHLIKDKSIVFSGFRNKDIEKYIAETGGSVKTTVSKNTDYLIVSNKNEPSGKLSKAIELGIKIVSPDDSLWKALFPGF